MTNCGQKKHEENGEEIPALTKAIWPNGQVIPLCLACALASVAIANAMGFKLAFVTPETEVKFAP